MTSGAYRPRRGGERLNSRMNDLFAGTTPPTLGFSASPKPGGRPESGSERRRDRDGGMRRLDALKQAATRALAILLVANFLGYATVGPNGILRWSGYHAQKNERTRELAQLAAEQSKLAHHIDLLDPAGTDPDYVDELLRTQLGLVRPDEVIITLP